MQKSDALCFLKFHDICFLLSTNSLEMKVFIKGILPRISLWNNHKSVKRFSCMQHN